MPKNGQYGLLLLNIILMSPTELICLTHYSIVLEEEIIYTHNFELAQKVFVESRDYLPSIYSDL